jgi:hypothetical protein
MSESVPSVIKVSSIIVIPDKATECASDKREEELRKRILSRQQEKVKCMDREMVDIPSTSSVVNEPLEKSSSKDDYFLGPLSKEYKEAEQKRKAQEKSLKKRFMKENRYALIDIEGTDPFMTEIGVFIVNKEEILEARIFHLRVKSKRDMIQGSKFCHGMEYDVLMSIAKHDQQTAIKEIRDWLESQESGIMVLSADESSDSDVSKMIHGWRVKYWNVCMPKWKERVHTRAYLETQVAK